MQQRLLVCSTRRSRSPTGERRAHAPENTLEAFQLGLRLGATGLESDVWLTADGVPVLDHDGEVRQPGLRKRRSRELRRDELPGPHPERAPTC